MFLQLEGKRRTSFLRQLLYAGTEDAPCKDGTLHYSDGTMASSTRIVVVRYVRYLGTYISQRVHCEHCLGILVPAVTIPTPLIIKV